MAITTRWGRGLGAVALVLAFAAGQTGAGAAAADPGRWSFYDSSFVLRLRAAAVEPELDSPQPVVPGVGYSAVNLLKDVQRPFAVCESRGIGAHIGDLVEPGGPEVTEGAPINNGRGFDNPTEARDTQPAPSTEANFHRRTPQIRSITDGQAVLDLPAQGNGVQWEAACDDDAGGRAVGDSVDLGGIEAAGSATVGRLDKRTGRYVGVSRAFVAGVHTAAGVLDLVSSVVQVEVLPLRTPKITYRISTTGGTLVQGTDVPLGDLTRQFNEAVAANAPALEAVGPFGLTLMGPTVSRSPDGARIMNAPYLELTLGLEARRGTLGHNSHLRLVNVDFDGAFYH